jgi:two-component system sensor histidine kinase EvgS
LCLGKNDTDLKIKVDNAMGNILSEDPAYYIRLNQKYATPDSTIKMLTREEKDYIAKHPSITIAVVANDFPYYKNNDASKPQGIIPDFYDRISQLTGLKPVYEIFTSYEEATKAVSKGKVDVLGIYSNGQIPAYSYGLRLTRAYDTMDMVLLTRSTTSIAQIKKVAVKGRSGKVLKASIAKFVQAEMVPYSNTMACFEALKDKQVDALVCGMPTATWLINQNQLGTYKMTTINASAMDICGATAYSNSMLCSILSKAVNVAAYSFNGIVTDNTLPESRLATSLARIPLSVIGAVTGVLLLLVICLIFALIQLRKRHKEQEAMNQAKIATERREIELAALEKNFEAKNAFFSNISHDMRTPSKRHP